MRPSMLTKTLLATAALMGSGTAFAENLALNSRIFVETQVKQADGTMRTQLVPAKRAAPGDTLVVMVDYRNPGASPATNVTVTNPVPSAIAYRSSHDNGAQVSIDGGRNWGKLEELRIANRDGSIRHAVPEDVTHIRWRFASAIPAGGTGKVSFRGVVR